MKKTESLYLDAVRTFAAVFVLTGHMALIMPNALWNSDYGHIAVIVFFVLSGYVIAFVAETKEKTVTDYLVSRAARLYSVALPALILTFLCDFIGHRAAGNAIYQNYPSDWVFLRLGAALTFTSELWFLSIQPLSNGPYWSLCYEAWYYLIFAAATYLSGHRRTVCLAALCLIVGPKILSMFPIWLFGVAVYRYRGNVGPRLGTLLFFGSAAALIASIDSAYIHALAKLVNHLMGNQLYRSMEYARNFPTDYIFGALFGLNFVAVRGLADTIEIPKKLGVVIRWAAGGTFSIYLFHRPLEIALIAVSNAQDNLISAIVITLTVIVSAVALSYVTERRKHIWRAGFQNVAALLSNHRVSAA